MNSSRNHIFSMTKRDRLITLSMILLLGGAAAVCCYFSYKAYLTSKQNVYVLDNGRAYRLRLEKDNISENRKAEAIAAVEHVLGLILTVTPDPERINYSHQKLKCYAGDGSLMSFVNDLKQKNYYTSIVGHNQHQSTYVDSVDLKDVDYGFAAVVHGRNQTISASEVLESAYEFFCVVRAVPRSLNNPDGFLIERFKLLKAFQTKRTKR